MQRKIKVILPKKLDNSCQREFLLKEDNKNYFQIEKEYKKDKITLITMFDKITDKNIYRLIGKLNNSPWYYIYSKLTTDNKFLIQSADYFTKIFQMDVIEYSTFILPISPNNPMLFEKLKDQKIKLLLEDDKLLENNKLLELFKLLEDDRVQALFFKEIKGLINNYGDE